MRLSPPSPAFNSTAYNTLSQVNGTTAPAGCDLNGNLYVNLHPETTKVIGTVNQGTSPWVVSNGGTFAVQAALVSTTNAGATVVKGGVGVVNGGVFMKPLLHHRLLKFCNHRLERRAIIFLTVPSSQLQLRRVL